jgi:hypothetical protein
VEPTPWQAAIGLLLLYVLPGFAIARALFPEWRFRGESGTLHAVETAVLTVVLSVASTILVGFVLLNSSAGFSADWSNPLLETGLLGITAVGGGLAWGRGAFARTPPTGPALEPEAGALGGAEALAAAEEIQRRVRRIRHELKAHPSPSEAARLQDELRVLEIEARRLGRDREASYHD